MLREAPVKTGTTFAEYIEFEQTSDVRHEFVDGNLFVMAGGTQRHNMLAGILYAQLLPVVLTRGCRIFINDLIVKTPSGKGYYPDVFVTCDSSLDSARFIFRPTLIVEVLSNSTEVFDRGDKWEQYQKMQSLEQYVLLSQSQAVAEVFSRQEEHWKYERLIENEVLKFSSLAFELVLSDLYKNLPAIEQDS
jgi:Uma2 family endonuclease